MQRRPVALRELGAGRDAEAEAVRGRALALLAHLLAVARAERREVVVEALERALRAVVPVELQAEARQVVVPRERAFSSSVQKRKCTDDARSCSATSRTPASSAAVIRRAAARRRPSQQRQPAPRRRRERDRRDELRVVAHARALRGVGPGPVEDELAVAVGLEVERHRADEAARAAPREHDARHAAGARTDAVRRLERGEKGVLEKRVVLARQPIPLGGRNGRDAVDDLQLDDGRA